MPAAEDPRKRILILVPILKGQVHEQRLLSQSRVYGATDTERDYFEYASTQGGYRPEGFPEWGELTRRLREGLAGRLNVKRSTLVEHLRKAPRRLLSSILSD